MRYCSFPAKVMLKIAFLVVSLICFTLPGIAHQASTSQQPFTITIAAENPEVKAGSDVWVKVTLTNNSSQDLTMKGGIVNRDYRFEVHDGSGNLLQYHPRSEPGYANWGSYFVQPSDSYIQSLRPSELYDMSTPGKYTIRVFRRASDTDPNAGEIGSNIVTVTVVRRAAATGQPPKVIITPQNPIVEDGSEVFVNATFNNNQDDPSEGIGNPKYRFEVRDKQRHLVKRIASPPPLMGMPFVVILESQETLTPGEYTIQAFRRADDPKGGEIKSNVATVTIQKTDVSRPPFSISIAVERSEFKSGSDVGLQVAMTNDSPYELSMSTAFMNGMSINWNYRFEVRDEAGNLVQKRVHPHPELATGEPVNYLVKPGETFPERQVPSDLYDMRTPGKYTVQVFRRASNDPKDGEIGSNIVTVTVLP